MSNIVVLSGSPRANGNTDMLVEAFVSGIDTDKHTVKVLQAARMNIHGCLGCNACYRNEAHRCAILDDMQSVYDALARADVLVIASPVYFYGLSSQLKAAIDRLHNPIRSTFPIKKLVLLGVCADTTQAVFASIKDMYRAVLQYFNLEDGGVITVCGLREKGSIAGEAALQDARALAARL